MNSVYIANIALGAFLVASLLILIMGSLFAIVNWLTVSKSSVRTNAKEQTAITLKESNWSCRNQLCLVRNPSHGRFCRNCGAAYNSTKEAEA